MFARVLALTLAALPLAARAAPGGDTVPRVPIATFDALPQPLPLPYDEAANADATVRAASARAKAKHKLLLIDLGGNWCLDCRLLARVMDLPQFAPWLKRHYELVTVDVGRFDKNLQIPARYGKAKLAGVPALIVVDPRTGRVLDKGREEALEDARSLTPQALADWLGQWVK